MNQIHTQLYNLLSKLRVHIHVAVYKCVYSWFIYTLLHIILQIVDYCEIRSSSGALPITDTIEPSPSPTANLTPPILSDLIPSMGAAGTFFLHKKPIPPQPLPTSTPPFNLLSACTQDSKPACTVQITWPEPSLTEKRNVSARSQQIINVWDTCAETLQFHDVTRILELVESSACADRVQYQALSRSSTGHGESGARCVKAG